MTMGAKHIVKKDVTIILFLKIFIEIGEHGHHVKAI